MNSLFFERVTVLAYHKIGWPSELGITTVLPKAFERQMKFLVEEGYQSLHPDQLIEGLSCPENLPPRSVLITFDDGYSSVYEIAYPILRQFGFTATIFMIAGYVGKKNSWEILLTWKRSSHLNWDQLNELARAGFCIGAHGYRHRFLTHTQKINSELGLSRALLEKGIQRSVEYFAYPYGDWNLPIAAQTMTFGYRGAFAYDPQTNVVHPHALPRIGIYLPDTLRSFQAKLGLRGPRAFRWECLKHRCIHRFTYANLLRPGYRRSEAATP